MFANYIFYFHICGMAFLRVEKKESGTYMRIVESYKEKGIPKHRTLYSLGKVEDYPSYQLENIAKKLLELAGVALEDIVAESFHEVGRVNYGYILIIKKLWKIFNMDTFSKHITSITKTKFNWIEVLQLMIVERLNEPSSKLSTYNNQSEYLGLSETYELQYFYRTLDLLAQKQDYLKQHLFKQQQNLFTQELDVVFYDVTTLYFESQKENPNSKRQKGYSKDGKAHKTQVVLGLLVDKLRNPITYNIYKGNTYEGGTMIDALSQLRKTHKIDKVVAVADSAMIDSGNRAFMEDCSINYIIGDRLKNLPENIQQQLLNKKTHKAVNDNVTKENFSYACIEYQGRKLICTYSENRAHKDAYEREKLIIKAEEWLKNPSKYKQAKKKGAGRFITINEDGLPLELNKDKIKEDAKYDGFKALSTTTDLSIEEVLEKYRDLFEVEHAFRTLKSQLEIRPVYHWTDERIEGHIAMCFIAYTFLNYLRNITQMQYREIIKAIDQMQMSIIEEGQSKEKVYMRSKITDNSEKILNKLKIATPKDTTPQNTVFHMFNH
jgi:transposase